MSFTAEKWAWQQQCRSAPAKYVLVFYAGYANEEGDRAFPSMQTVCRVTQLAEQTVRRALADNIEDGLMERVERHAPNGRQLSTEYRLKLRETTPSDLPGGEGTKSTRVRVVNPPLDPPTSTRGRVLDPPGNPTTVVPREVQTESHHQTPESVDGGVARTRTRERRTQVSESWQPGEQGIAFAESKGVPDVGDQVERFIAYHRSRGSLMADWSAAWRTWCSNYRRFADERQQRQPANDARGLVPAGAVKAFDPNKLSGAARALWNIEQERIALRQQQAQEHCS